MLSRSTGLIFVFFHISCYFALLESNFLMYDKNVNKCLKGNQPLKLFYCDSNQPSQQFRWTSNDRIFNVDMKKCLGAGSTGDGSGLQWYICDETSVLQKWECKNDTLLSLKGKNLFLSQDENTVLKLTQDSEAASQWLIHGTTEGLCSQPYQELYTIGGNALGQPCHFPFQFEGKWYSDCIPKKSTNRLWCSTDRDYQQKWGYCPTKSTEHWKKNPVTGVFYQANINSALTWHQARKSCQQQDSDLLSITEPQEQTFISGITSEFKTILWIGLNQLNTEKGWQWTNGEPFRYLRWGSGQPKKEPEWSCGSLSTMQNYGWQNKLCSVKHGYICQKGTEKPTNPPTPPVSCSSPWIPFAGHCYFLNRTKTTWKEANTQCLIADGHLASIHNIEEQSFVLSQLGYLETDKLWIGLSDQKTQLLFEWSDQSPVTFTVWDVQEPSHHRYTEEDCVLMGGKEGKWADEVCTRKCGFICKKAGDSTSDAQNSAPSEGCKTGWIRHGYSCYLVGSQTKTFEDAKEICKTNNAYLVDVQSRVENAFLISLVGARPEKHFWVGLSNQRDRYTFEWTNTENVPYTHWNSRMPGQKQGCVAMTTGTLAGLWDVLSCSSKEKYICKHQAEGVVTTPAPPTSPSPSCAEGWMPLGNRHFCYKFYDMDYSEGKTWFQALDFCRSIGGDLISIHSYMENVIIGIGWRGWIGYSAQDPSVGYTWSDGTASSFTNWKTGAPDNKHNMENCAYIEFLSREWEDLPCDKKEDFICEIRKGDTPKTPANVTIPEHNVIEDGWTEFSGHQYYISVDAQNMDNARKICKEGRGDLVVINSEAERIFLWRLISDLWSSFYIGMTTDFEFNTEWIDGTPVVYQRWDVDQPPEDTDDKNCVVMDHSYGLWSVINCGSRRGFICERDETPHPNATLAPTEAPKGGCAPEWTKYRQYCYKTEFSPKTWKEAREICRAEGGYLVSILSKQEQAFLTMMLKAPGDLWIGLRYTHEIVWTDSKAVTFTNFNRLKTDPEFYPYWPQFDSKDLCYKMISSPSMLTGHWRPAKCNDTNGYICKRTIDSHIVPQTTALPQSYVKVGNDSFKLQPNNLTWWEAKRSCEADGAHLASIRDAVTQAYMELLVDKLKLPIWIGLNKNETGGYFRWIDGWPLSLISWSRNEPKTHFSCVLLDTEGYWKTASCNQSLPSVCKKSKDIAPTPDTQYVGVCPESFEDRVWYPFRGHCYMFPNTQDYGHGALMSCLQKGASLLSIVDTDEAEFINSMLEMVRDTYETVWIGLYKNQRGQWHWLDKSVVDYTNWAETEPDDYNDHAGISTADFKWRSVGMYMYGAYICKTAKVLISASPTTKPGPQDVHRSFAIVVVVVFVALVILLGTAAIMYSKGYKSSRPSFENPLYFKVSNSEGPDNKTLINNVELE